MAWSDVSDLEDYLHRTFTVEENGMASIALAGAKVIIKTFCHQTLDETLADSVVVEGNGRDVMVLREFPVTDVADVVIEDETFDGTSADNVRVTTAGLLYRMDGGTWTAGVQNITVTYDHGYPDADEAWDAIKVVQLSVAGRLFEQGGVSGENIGGYSVTYDSTGPDLTEGEECVLAAYRSKY